MRAYLAAGALAAVLAAGWWLFDQGRGAERSEQQARDLEAWERVNDADVSRGDPDDDLGWLHEWIGGQQ